MSSKAMIANREHLERHVEGALIVKVYTAVKTI